MSNGISFEGTNIFKDPKTLPLKAFRILEDAIGALKDLEDI